MLPLAYWTTWLLPILTPGVLALPAHVGAALLNRVMPRAARPRMFFRFAFMMLFSFLIRLQLFQLRPCHVADLCVDHVVVLLFLSQCTVCSVGRGVINGGTFVHCQKARAQATERKGRGNCSL